MRRIIRMIAVCVLVGVALRLAYVEAVSLKAAPGQWAVSLASVVVLCGIAWAITVLFLSCLKSGWGLLRKRRLPAFPDPDAP